MARKIIFVGGIHGSGKSYFCRKVHHSLQLEYITASSLIGRSKEKQVQNVPANQDILVDAIHSKLSRFQNYLIDGHFCLLTKSSEVEKVNIKVF